MRFVFCVGMYRACSTWQYDILCHLVETKLGGQRLGFVDADDFARVRAQTPASAPIGVLKSHDAGNVFAKSLRAGEGVPIYAYRDLRDVAYSFMHKATLSFEHLISDRFLPKVLSNDHFWRSQPGAFVQKYEDLLNDQRAGVQQLADRLGIALDEGEAARLAEGFSWQANFRRTLEVRRVAEAAGVDLADQANTNKQDPVTLLHWNHMRVRRSVSWRDLSTVAERETLAFLCGDWLIANGYETDRSWIESPHQGPEGGPRVQRTPAPEPQVSLPQAPTTRTRLASRWRLKPWLKMQGPEPLSRRKVGG